MRSTLAWALVLALALPARGAEIDSVTARNAELRNSMRSMNRWVNALVRSGVRRANERADGCDEDELYKQVKKAISSPFIGHSITEDLNAAEDLDSRRVAFRDSIYRDLGIFDAISVHLKDLSAVIRMGDHLIGVDKFGHFFVQGWKYFDIAYRDGDGIAAAMDWGEHAERTYFGFYTTGVYSYADLATNLEGMRFWLRLLGREKDPLESGYFRNRPYVKCGRRLFFGKRRWRMSRKIRLADYVSGAWDEGMNCSSYRTPEIQALIERRIEEREAIDSESYTCPIEPDPCARARERYESYADRLLHPRCLRAEPQPRPWWKHR